MACARTVAVVVPSPATSEVLEATSRNICAPMFSRPSCSSISLATVTPSLVMVGDPNFFSITTLRPLGPRVTFTASARRFTPRRIACRDSSPCTICFAIIRISDQKLRILLPRLRNVLGCMGPLRATGASSPLPPGSDGCLLADARQHAQNFLFLDNQKIFVVNLDLSARILAKQDVVSLFHREREDLAVFIAPALAHGDHLDRKSTRLN